VLPVLCALAVAACAGGASPPPPAGDRAPPADTLRGRVEVVGSEPGTSIALLDGRGGWVTLEGERAALRALSGLEVMVEGRMEQAEPFRVFRVARVAVRAADGVAAVDGVIAREGGGHVLVTGDGRRLRVPHLPAQLAGRVGARVWLAGPLDRPPDTFGIIAEAP
jgi:hypothetical protein